MSQQHLRHHSTATLRHVTNKKKKKLVKGSREDRPTNPGPFIFGFFSRKEEEEEEGHQPLIYRRRLPLRITTRTSRVPPPPSPSLLFTEYQNKISQLRCAVLDSDAIHQQWINDGGGGVTSHLSLVLFIMTLRVVVVVVVVVFTQYRPTDRQTAALKTYWCDGDNLLTCGRCRCRRRRQWDATRCVDDVRKFLDAMQHATIGSDGMGRCRVCLVGWLVGLYSSQLLNNGQVEKRRARAHNGVAFILWCPHCTAPGRRRIEEEEEEVDDDGVRRFPFCSLFLSSDTHTHVTRFFVCYLKRDGRFNKFLRRRELSTAILCCCAGGARDVCVIMTMKWQEERKNEARAVVRCSATRRWFIPKD